MDGTFADLDSEFEEFAADALGAPGDVFGSHLLDQGDGFGCDPGLRCLGFGLAAPDEAEQLTMPAEEGVGLDDEEGLFPEGRCSGQEQESDAVLIADLRAFGVALEDDELVPEEGILGDEIGSAADHVTSCAGDQQVRTGSEAALDAVAELVRNGAEDLRPEARDEMKHVLMAPEI